MSRRRISTAQRRARLARRHHLVDRAADPATVADALVALHGTDPVTVYLSLFARLVDPRHEVVEQALYEDRSLVRLLGMRRTIFVPTREVAPLVQASSSLKVAATERKRLLKYLADTDGDRDPEQWLAEVEALMLKTIDELGETSVTEVAAADPRLAERVSMGAGTKWSTTASVASRLMLLLGVEGRIVRTRPKGTWVSGQFRWATWEDWLGAPLPELDVHEAQVELARRWLRAFGPGTFDDLKWWTGWTVRELRRALEVIGPVVVDLDDGRTGLVLPDDLDDDPEPEPWAALLPSLDATVMGWSGPGRGWYLGEYAPLVFDSVGNAGPTVWWNGRVVGGWGQRRDGGEIVYRLLEDVGADAEAAIRAEADRLAAAIGPVVVMPRFDSPLGRELASS